MARIILPNNGSTVSINGTRLRHLAEGDNISISFPNDRTGRVNSETGVTIHERSDAEVADITLSVQKYSDDDVFLSGLLQTDPLTVVEGSIKTRYNKDGNELTETYTIEAGSFTAQPEKTINTQDGSAVMEYTIQARKCRRVI